MKKIRFLFLKVRKIKRMPETSVITLQVIFFLVIFSLVFLFAGHGKSITSSSPTFTLTALGLSVLLTVIAVILSTERLMPRIANYRRRKP